MNPHRGEVEIALSERSFLMRPTYAGIVRYETETGFGSVELFQRVQSRLYTHREIVAIVTAGIKEASPPGEADLITDQKVGQMVVEAGVLNVVPNVVRFLENALTGGRKPGKDEAAEGKPLSPSAA